MITISANIIMKNESKVLPRLLNSIWPILDYYVICDTGSTDNSVHIVTEFFKEKNISGEIIYKDFINFSDARNFALENIKGKADFGFWIDCDEQLVLSDNFDIITFKKELSKFDKGTCEVIYGQSRYGRNCFFRTSKPFKWIGSVHELLICDENLNEYNIHDMCILVTPDGNSWTAETEKNKYLNHAKILEQEVYKNNNPRDVFYLAQSYRDALEPNKAIEWYKKRAHITDGFYEEQYYAQYMVANLSRIDNSFEAIILEYCKAHEIDSMRGEHILNLIIQLQNNNMWQTAYIFSSYAVAKYHGKNPYPKKILFLDEGTYTHKILDAHILNCQKTNNINEILQYMNIDSLYENLCKTPSDINYHLPKLKECAEKYGRCCEVGVRWVVSTYALLAGKPSKLVSYDINYHSAIEQAKLLAKQENIDFTFIHHNILTTEIEETDFLFIDSWHCNHQLEKELQLHANKVKKAIAFHDTTTFWNIGEDGGLGLKYAIEPFLENNKEWKQVYRTEENNGFLIIEKQN